MFKVLRNGVGFAILGIGGAFLLVLLGILSLKLLGCWGVVTWPIALLIFIGAAHYYITHPPVSDETQLGP